ncbi:MAG: LapA family protein [Alphaproteobacteria bacterium]|nr:LapA family protein [Alphaproteobacteria bacterium]
MRILGWIVAAVAALILIAFSIANRGGITISFAPLPFALDVPLFAVALASLAIGLFAGVIAKTVTGSPNRRQSRARAHRIKALEREVADLRTERDRLRRHSIPSLPGGHNLPVGPTKDAA